MKQERRRVDLSDKDEIAMMDKQIANYQTEIDRIRSQISDLESSLQKH